MLRFELVHPLSRSSTACAARLLGKPVCPRALRTRLSVFYRRTRVRIIRVQECTRVFNPRRLHRAQPTATTSSSATRPVIGYRPRPSRATLNSIFSLPSTRWENTQLVPRTSSQVSRENSPPYLVQHATETGANVSCVCLLELQLFLENYRWQR